MMAVGDYLANGVLNWLRGSTMPTAPATVYLSAHTADPGTTGASEATGGSYARQAVALDAVSSRATANTDLERFTGMPAGTYTHLGLWTAATSGNFLLGGAATSRTLASGDTLEVSPGELDVTY